MYDFLTQPQKLAKAKYQDNLQLLQWFKGHFGQQISDQGPYNALKKRHEQKVNLLFTDQKHFDLRQTMTKDPRNKQNQVRSGLKLIHSASMKQEQQPNRPVLGLKSMNTSSQEIVKSTQKLGLTQKTSSNKENQTSISILGDKNNVKKKKLTVTSSTANKILLYKAVEVVESDGEDCF